MSLILKLQNYLKSSLNKEQQDKLKRLLVQPRYRGIQHLLYHTLCGSNLKTLAVLNMTDKWSSHWYAQHYETHFASLRKKSLNILEIGIGGYKDPELGGGSLRMWRTYFPNSKIHGIDIYDKSFHQERRIKIFQGSQIDEDFLEKVIQEVGTIDIIIDDGSHLNEHVIKTFKILFPKLKTNGIYVIEDTQTSYWKGFGGTSANFNSLETSMGFSKSLIDSLNYAEFDIDNYEPNYYDKNIVAMHFYHNLVFINKGLNNEGSNWRKNSD
jgi:hypothetical protein